MIQVVFLTERYNAADLPLDTGLMKKIREQAALRLQAMMDYVKEAWLQDAENTCVLWRSKQQMWHVRSLRGS